MQINEDRRDKTVVVRMEKQLECTLGHSHKAVENLDERNAVYINVLSDAGIESNKAFSN